MKKLSIFSFFLFLSINSSAQSRFNSSEGLYLKTNSPVVSNNYGINAMIGYRFNDRLSAELNFTGSGYLSFGSSYLHRIGKKDKWGVGLSASVFRDQYSFSGDYYGFSVDPFVFRTVDISDKWKITPTLQLNTTRVDESYLSNLELSVPVTFKFLKNSSITLHPSYRITGSQFTDPNYSNGKFNIGLSIDF